MKTNKKTATLPRKKGTFLNIFHKITRLLLKLPDFLSLWERLRTSSALQNVETPDAGFQPAPEPPRWRRYPQIRIVPCAGLGVDAGTRLAGSEQSRGAGAFRIRAAEKHDLLTESNARARSQALARCLEGDYVNENTDS